MLRELSLFLAALIIFLFAIAKLSSEIQKLFTDRVRQYIRYAVRTPFYGLITGIVSTILFQSSSTTTALVVGMVSAGLISLYNGLAIVLGTDIGTAVTVQLVVWKVTALFPVCIVAGGLLYFVGEGKRRAIGEAILYFGLVLFSLYLIGEATAPIKRSEQVMGLLQGALHPFFGFAAGVIFTAIVHASAIPISMLAILAQQDLVTLENALPVVIGANVGTTVTALLAGLVSNVSGKRTALAHVFFKCAGAAVCLPLLPILGVVLKHMSAGVSQQIALGHFLFNVIIVSIFMLFLKPVSKMMEKLVPGEAETLPLWPEFLNEACLARPEDALSCVRQELGRQISLAQSMVRESIGLYKTFRMTQRSGLAYVEAVVDNLRSEIAGYLWRISDREFSEELSKRLFTYTAMVDDIERIGDHAMILAKLATEKHQRHLEFSERGKIELDEIHELVLANVEDAAFLVTQRDGSKIQKVFWREETIDVKVREARERHLERFHKRISKAEASPIFLEMLINLERISDHCQNIAEYAKELNDR
jgi:phosphate:Na+ symporter